MRVFKLIWRSVLNLIGPPAARPPGARPAQHASVATAPTSTERATCNAPNCVGHRVRA